MFKRYVSCVFDLQQVISLKKQHIPQFTITITFHLNFDIPTHLKKINGRSCSGGCRFWLLRVLQILLALCHILRRLLRSAALCCRRNRWTLIARPYRLQVTEGRCRVRSTVTGLRKYRRLWHFCRRQDFLSCWSLPSLKYHPRNCCKKWGWFIQLLYCMDNWCICKSTLKSAAQRAL